MSRHRNARSVAEAVAKTIAATANPPPDGMRLNPDCFGRDGLRRRQSSICLRQVKFRTRFQKIYAGRAVRRHARDAAAVHPNWAGCPTLAHPAEGAPVRGRFRGGGGEASACGGRSLSLSDAGVVIADTARPPRCRR